MPFDGPAVQEQTEPRRSPRRSGYVCLLAIVAVTVGLSFFRPHNVDARWRLHLGKAFSLDSWNALVLPSYGHSWLNRQWLFDYGLYCGFDAVGEWVFPLTQWAASLTVVALLGAILVPLVGTSSNRSASWIVLGGWMLLTLALPILCLNPQFASDGLIPVYLLLILLVVDSSNQAISKPRTINDRPGDEDLQPGLRQHSFKPPLLLFAIQVLWTNTASFSLLGLLVIALWSLPHGFFGPPGGRTGAIGLRDRSIRMTALIG